MDDEYNPASEVTLGWYESTPRHIKIKSALLLAFSRKARIARKDAKRRANEPHEGGLSWKAETMEVLVLHK